MDVEQKPAEASTDVDVAKCVKFFKTLINLTQQNQNQGKYAPDALETVRSLIESVIAETILPEEFAERLEDVLKSKTQPQLLTFIYKTLPAVRIALLNGQQSIEGIRYAGPPGSEANSQQNTQYPKNEVIDDYEEKPVVNNFRVIRNEAMEHQPVQTFVMPAAPIVTALPDNMPYTMLDSRAIITRLAGQVPGCEGIEQEVIAKISEAAEDHLRQMLTELSEIAGHRLEPLKMNPHYQQINDPRKQLKFVEEHEKQAFMRREAVEKEALMKSGKAKTKDNALKAKEMKNANQEEKLSREANDAALAALRGSTGTASRDKTVPAMIPGGGVRKRPMIRRINLNDFLCLLDCKNAPESAIIKKYSIYGLLNMNDQGDFGTI